MDIQNNDLTATVRITEEELEAIMGNWFDVGDQQGGRTDDEFARDRALAIARIRYWEGVIARAYLTPTGDNVTKWATEWGVTPQQEIAALEARGESPLQIAEAKRALNLQ